MTSYIKNTKISFRLKAIFYSVLLGFSILTLQTFADFTPTTPSFPHGDGIYHRNAADNGDGDMDGNDRNLNQVRDYHDDCEVNKICYYGLQGPSFNNYRDTRTTTGETYEGFTDERRFLVGTPYVNRGDTQSYTNTVNVTVDNADPEIVITRSYIHNNGEEESTATTDTAANNVKLTFPGFHYIGLNNDGKKVYETDLMSQNGELIIKQTIDSSNTTSVSDDMIFKSTDGKEFRLQYIVDSDLQFIYRNEDIYTLDPEEFVNGGNNIGTVKGCHDAAFLIYTSLVVVEASSSDYDLNIKKTVGTDQANVDANPNQQNLDVTAGQKVLYKLSYSNDDDSSSLPFQTKIYDKYDTEKLTITSADLPDDENGKCEVNPNYDTTNHIGLITCDAKDLAPSDSFQYYYWAKVKDNTTGTINNNVEIIPDNNSNPDDNTGAKGTKNRNPNDLDTNGANDDSSATLTVKPDPINGTCGDAAQTYTASQTAYPSGTKFCSSGTANPTNPAFPAEGQTVTWDCKASNGGTDASPKCQATRTNAPPVDLKIEKSVNPTTELAGHDVTYTIKYQNLTDNVTAKNVQIVDDYEESKITIINSSLPNGCTNSNPANKITCNIGDLNKSQGVQTITYKATIKNGVNSGTSIKNIAKITTDTPTTNTENDEDDAVVTVKEPLTDVTIIKSVNEKNYSDNHEIAKASSDEKITYTLKYRNTIEGSVAKETRVTDQPDFENLDKDTLKFTTEQGVVCQLGDPDALAIALGMDAQASIICTVGDLAYSANFHEIQYTIYIKKDRANNTIINNKAVITTTTDETNSNNNDSTARVVVTAEPINGTCGNAAKEYPTGTTKYPEGSVFCSSGTVNPNPPAFPNTGETITWNCEGSNGGTNAEPTCQASVADDALPAVDIEIKKSVEGKYFPDIAQAKAGNTVTYKLEYKNNTSGVTATNVIIKDYPDTESIDINSIKFQSETGVTCQITQDSDALVAVLQGRYIECTVGNLEYSANYHTLTYTAKIKDSTASGKNIDNTAKICTDNPETNNNNNNDHARVKVVEQIAEYDVKIEKTVNTKKEVTVAKNSTVHFKLSYENLSSSKDTAKDVKIVDIYKKDKIQIIESTLSNGCTNNSTDGKITCVLGNLTVGQKGEVTYDAKLLAGFTTGSSINTAVITPNPDTDTNAENDTSSAKVNILSSNEYDLTIDKKVDGVINKDVVAGQKLTYTLKYKNLTAGTIAKDVKIFDIFDDEHLDYRLIEFQNPLPEGVECKVTSDEDPVYYIMTGEHIECTIGDLPYGDEKTITYTIKVNDDVTAGTKIKNIAEIKPNPDNDTNEDNDTSETEVTVSEKLPEYDLKIVKTVNSKKEVIVNKNSTVHFKLKYENLVTSKDTATNVKIVDTYKTDKIEIIESSLPDNCKNEELLGGNNSQITCTIGTLTVGQKGEITYDAKLKSAFTSGETINNVVITPNPDNDTNPANDTSSAKVKIKSNGGTTPTNGVCGTASKTYSASTTAYPNNSQFCKYGTAVPNPPAFPAQGASVSWTCQGSAGGTNITCNASRYKASTGGGGGSGGGCNTNANIDLNIAKYVKIDGGGYQPAGSRETAAQLIPKKSQKATYKIIISNAGNASAHNVKVKDTFSSSNGVTHGAIQTESGATYEGGIFSIVAAIPANGTREFTYSTTLTNDGDAIGVNTARIQSFDTDYTCPKINSKKGVGRTSVAYVKTKGVAQNPNYILDKTADKHSVKTGDIVTYTLSIKNTGNVDMKNVVLIDKFPSEFLEPTERFKKRLINNRTLEFKRKFLPVGDTFSMKVEMIVREGVPQGTEIQNILTGRSDTVDIKDKSMETIIVSEGDAPICPTGYKWTPELNKCKRIYTPHRNIQTGLDNPFLPIGIMMLGMAFIIRRKDIADYLSSKI